MSRLNVQGKFIQQRFFKRTVAEIDIFKLKFAVEPRDGFVGNFFFATVQVVNLVLAHVVKALHLHFG